MCYKKSEKMAAIRSDDAAPKVQSEAALPK
jgi:hypothetical protein